MFFTVDGGERAIIFDQFGGVKPKVYGEGWHPFIPGVQQPKIFEIRTRPKVITSPTGTRDMQTAFISLRILFHPEAEYLPTIFLNLGENYDERVLPSIVNEVLKAVVAQYNADQLLTQREKVSAEIKEILINRAAEFKIHLDDVAITHLQFSKEFTQAIEGKQVAQQNAERSKFIVMKNEELKKAAIIRAEGEAEAAHLVADAVGKSGPGIISQVK
jgi:prohibitin 1